MGAKVVKSRVLAATKANQPLNQERQHRRQRNRTKHQQASRQAASVEITARQTRQRDGGHGELLDLGQTHERKHHGADLVSCDVGYYYFGTVLRTASLTMTSAPSA